MAELRVLVIADDPLARTGLAALLRGALFASGEGLAVVGQISATADLLSDMDMYQPHVALWDLGWGAGPVSDRLSELQEAPYPVVALVTGDAQAVEAWASGVKGVLPRDAGSPVLLAALQAAGQGLSVLAEDFRNAVSQPKELPALLLDPLTSREMDVLRLLAEGLPNKLIESRLAISEHTVKFHINAILGKLGAQSRTEAVTMAVRWGLVHL